MRQRSPEHRNCRAAIGQRQAGSRPMPLPPPVIKAVRPSNIVSMPPR
ncbi:hypothetical protein I552_2489 [Mycobacterium xenopi 3993]|nr:hypothetical protein I552_2489 [Mycobacterium xenopi 3993]